MTKTTTGLAIAMLMLISCTTMGDSTSSFTKPRRVAVYPEAPVGHPQVPLLKRGLSAMGSGVVVADGWILTAAHVLPITTANGRPCGKPIIHPTLDLALIPCPKMKWNGLTLAEAAPKLYDRLYGYGWHLCRALLKTEGYQGYPQTSMSVPGIHGCSGGAVVNDRGELVGIIRSVAYTGTASGGDMYALPHITGYTPVDLKWVQANLPK